MCANFAYLYCAKKKSLFSQNFRLDCGNFSTHNTNSCKIWKIFLATFCSPKPLQANLAILLNLTVVPSSGVRYCSPYQIKH